MSRAFVTEDTHIDALPDRPISERPNLVTSTGRALTEAALEAARRAYAEAQAEGDSDHLASAGRDLRYWNAACPQPSRPARRISRACGPG